VIATWPTYSYRRVTAQIRRDKQWIVNGKRVRRLMQAMGLQAKVRSKRRRTVDSQYAYPRYPNLVHNLKVVRPDQVWVSDIIYVHLLMEFVYLAVIMDVFTCAIRGWHLARNLDHGLP
jgi:putative transposase